MVVSQRRRLFQIWFVQPRFDACVFLPYAKRSSPTTLNERFRVFANNCLVMARGMNARLLFVTMRQTFAIGGEFDALTPAEFSDSLDKVIEKLAKTDVPSTIRQSAIGITDASGNLGGGIQGNGIELFQMPLGFHGYLYRLVVMPADGSGFTAAAPISQGYVYIRRNDADGPTELFLPSGGSQIAPNIYEGGDTGPDLDNGERLLIIGTGLPNNIELSFFATWRMWRGPQRERFQGSR